MDLAAKLVADELGLETPPAKGSDIVVGQECTATNKWVAGWLGGWLGGVV